MLHLEERTSKVYSTVSIQIRTNRPVKKFEDESSLRLTKR